VWSRFWIVDVVRIGGFGTFVRRHDVGMAICLVDINAGHLLA
jgi:hypothetical protein